MPRILIVDDVPEILEMLRSALEGAGFEATAVPDGAAAIRLCQTERFDTILCDVNMPQITGCDLARWVSRHHPATQMILMSGSELGCSECPYVPACVLIRKPFRLADLVQILERALAGG